MLSLIIDASSPTLFAGVAQDNSWKKFLQKETGALEGLFDLAKDIFRELPLEKIERMILCHGPGRLMSLRVAAMAANEWCREHPQIKKYSYNSLQLASLTAQGPVGYFVRADTFLIFRAGQTEMSPSSQGATLINDKSFPYTLEKLPEYLEKIIKPTEFFNPPVFAPTAYATAKNFSKTS